MIYKNKFIALYDQDDMCICIANEWDELADFLEKSVNSIQSSISHMLKDNKNVGETVRKHLIYKGKKVTPYIYDIDEEEEW